MKARFQVLEDNREAIEKRRDVLVWVRLKSLGPAEELIGF